MPEKYEPTEPVHRFDEREPATPADVAEILQQYAPPPNSGTHSEPRGEAQTSDSACVTEGEQAPAQTRPELERPPAPYVYEHIGRTGGLPLEFSRPKQDILRSMREHSTLTDRMVSMLPGMGQLRQRNARRAFGDSEALVMLMPHGAVRVMDGHTRLWNALEAGLAPEKIPVNIGNRDHTHTTLAECIALARATPA